MRTALRPVITLTLFVVTVASLSFGVDSEGLRGIALGLLLPACCVAGVSAMQGLLPAFGVAAAAWLIGLRLASSIGNNIDHEVIDLWPFFYAVGLLFAGCLGMLCRIGVESIRDRPSSLG